MIQTCLFPAAGYGTRFLPATKSLPKEMLPILTKPLIHYGVDEALEAGMDNMAFVTGRGKRALEDYFDRSYELEDQISGSSKEYLLDEIRALMKRCTFSFTRQEQMKGLGNAIYTGKILIRDEPFGVVLADDLCVNENGEGVLAQMVKIYEKYRCSVVAVMEVPPQDVNKYGIIAGKSFTEDVSWSHEVMVSRRFVDKMKAFADWRDGAVGKQILVTEHSGANNDEPFTICGVYDDIRIGTIQEEDERPSILFYSSDPKESNYLLLKFHHMTPEAMQHVRQELQKLMPDREVELCDWRAEMAARYADTQRFRNAVMIGVVITLLISLIGLMGYTGDEINRRRKEIAVRKINGATLGEVLHLFERDIIRIAAPALVAGCGASAYVANLWQTGFSEKISLAWYLFALSGLLLLCLIIVIVALHVRRAAAENPVKSIKSE